MHAHQPYKSKNTCLELHHRPKRSMQITLRTPSIPCKAKYIQNTPFPLSPQKTLFSVCFKTLALGIISAQKINLGGEIYAGEIIAIIYLLLNLRKPRIGKPLRLLLIFGVLWSACQFISDQANNTATLDSIKGIAAPLVFIGSITGLAIFFTFRLRRLPSFIFGASLGLIPGLIINPGEYFASNPWKWGIGQLTLSLALIYFTFFLKNKKTIYLLLFSVFFSAISLLNDSRSLAIFPLLAILTYIATQKKLISPALKIFQGKFSTTKVTVFLAAALLCTNALFTAIFSSNLILDSLPEESARKFKMQAAGEYGVLLGGRNELLISIEAFLDKPFLGHGSWAKDNSGYQERLATLSYTLGYADTDKVYSAHDLIPVHSFMMGALVWAGIAGGIFWIYIMRWLISAFTTNIQHLGIYYFSGVITLMWDIMFSPFGASSRWSSALFLSALYCYSKYISERKLTK